MSILLVVQAGRDGTDRNDRQLAPFGATTVLETSLSRLTGFSEGPVVLAISDLPPDDTLEGTARDHEVAVVRGPSDDMLGRFVEVIADYPAEHLVRITAESPFLDHHLVSEIVQAHIESGADYTSNTLLRTYPRGLDVEAIRSDALLDAAEQASAASERAGVTTFVHRRPADYKLHAAIASGDYEDHDWLVTGQDSLDRFAKLVAKSGGDATRAWNSLLSFDRPIPPDEPLRLRVARANVEANLATFTETIGYPPDPFPIGEASRRSWGVWDGENLIGAVVVSMQNGWGTFAGRFIPGLSSDIAQRTLAAVDTCLLADDQTIALTIDGTRIRNYQD